MTFNDSSSIILIIGAIAILAFVVHGLWFSGRSVNRRLLKNSKEDIEIANSSAVGKVRIIMPKNDPSDSKENAPEVETFSHKSKQAAPQPVKNAAVKQDQVIGDAEIASVGEPEKSYEINLFAVEGHPYKGMDLEELFATYGFIRDKNNIFCVYEEPRTKANVVFRICSLEAPYAFPVQMQNFSTKALAIYMNLPAKGKGYIYFKAMRIAANCLVEHLGGVICDNDNKEISEEYINRVEKVLKKYDKKDTPAWH